MDKEDEFKIFLFPLSFYVVGDGKAKVMFAVWVWYF